MQFPSLSLILALLPFVAFAGDALKAPVTPKKPQILEKHGYKRTDNYFWLRDKTNSEVISYLKEENAYAEQMMASTANLQKKIFEEMKSRVKEKDSSLPYLDQGYYYYNRIEVGMQYQIHARKKGSLSAPEEILIDGNEQAKGQPSYHGGGPNMSPNHKLMAQALNFTGDRVYSIQFKDLEKNEILPFKLEKTNGSLAWAADNETVYYIGVDDAIRSCRLYRANIRTGKTEELFFEADDKFRVGVGETLTGNHIVFSTSSALTGENYLLDAHDPQATLKLVQAREPGHDYGVLDGGDRLFILTNWNATNFRLMEAPLDNPGKENWKEVIAHDPQVALEGVRAFKNHLVASTMKNGARVITVFDRKTMKGENIQFPENASEAYLSSANLDFDPKGFRYIYESMKTPSSIYMYDLASHQSTVLKVDEVPGYNADIYQSERIFITARDGVKVPVTLLYKKGIKRDGKAPLYVYGYGAYGMSMTPSFSSGLFSLIDRGFVHAVIHVRGGSELGRTWFDTGRGKFKMNSFRDFIDGTEALLRLKYGSPRRVYAMGGSAGGLLMGAVMNMRPDLYRGVIAQVPFVDVLSTMLDDTLPLTTGEYEQWGNPNVKEDYETMAEYSPVDNIHKASYPYVLATGGINDSQVPYWEPSKLVAKMRDYNQGKAFQLLKINLESGHGGASGRFDSLKESAFEKAFFLLLDQPMAKQAK